MHTNTLAIDEQIYTSSLKLLYPLSEKKTYKTIVEEAKKLLEGAYASLFILNNGQMKRVYTTYNKLMKVIPRKDGITMRSYTEKKSFIRTFDESVRLYPIFTSIKFGSDITIPLFFENKTFGVISVLSNPNITYTQQDLNILKKFSPLASLSLHNMNLRKKLAKEVATRDYFISIASHELKLLLLQ